ncbi:hypothetical protein EMIT048CA2_70175 [Pseudomonas chlororaphis]
MRMRCPASQGSFNRAKGTRVVLPAPGGASSTASWRVARASRRAGKTSSIGKEFILAPKQRREYNGELPGVNHGLNSYRQRFSLALSCLFRRFTCVFLSASSVASWLPPC